MEDKHWIIFVLHTLVLGLLWLLYVAQGKKKISSPLAVVIAQLAITIMFWSIAGMTGSTAGVDASWYAIGITCGSYCLCNHP